MGLTSGLICVLAGVVLISSGVCAKEKLHFHQKNTKIKISNSVEMS